MNTLKKLTKEQATSLTIDIITCINSHNKKLRTMLVNAQLSNIHTALGFESYEEYLAKRIVPKIRMKKDYAKNLTNAGMVEMQILGMQKIGAMKEYPLRKLYENVDECNRVKVYQLARKGLEINKYPTGTQIVEAAKELKVYKQKASKSNLIEKDAVTKTNSNNKKPEINKLNTKDPTVPSRSNITPIKSLSSRKASKTIIDTYQINDIKNILGYLRVFQNKKMLKEFSHIVENCKEDTISNLIIKLSQYLKDCHAATKAKNIKKVI